MHENIGCMRFRHPGLLYAHFLTQQATQGLTTFRNRVLFCVRVCLGGVYKVQQLKQQLQIISILFVRTTLSFLITRAKTGGVKKERTQVTASALGRQNGLSLVPQAVRNNGPPLRDINHKPLSSDICLYIFKFSDRKHTSSLFTFHVNREPLRLHLTT